MLKIFKEHNKLQKFLTDFLSIGLGFQRLFFFIMIFLLLLHIVSCLWLIVASLYADEIIINPNTTNEKIELDYTGTWLEDYAKLNHTNDGLYAISIYWTVTTITTVGYGDIGGSNNLERLFCSITMIIGVVSFSFANGSLASIIQNFDHSNAQYQEKLIVLNRIYKEYKLPLDLFIKIKKSMGYESQKQMNDLHNFI